MAASCARWRQRPARAQSGLRLSPAARCLSLRPFAWLWFERSEPSRDGSAARTLRQPLCALSTRAGRPRSPGPSSLSQRARPKVRELALALEDLLQALEVLAELFLGPPGEEPRRETGDVALGDHRQPRSAVRRLELVPHGERHRAVERAQREDARLLPVNDLERRVELTPEEGTRLLDPSVAQRRAF